MGPVSIKMYDKFNIILERVEKIGDWGSHFSGSNHFCGRVMRLCQHFRNARLQF
jgi:hypothetical protein